MLWEKFKRCLGKGRLDWRERARQAQSGTWEPSAVPQYLSKMNKAAWMTVTTVSHSTVSPECQFTCLSRTIKSENQGQDQFQWASNQDRQESLAARQVHNNDADPRSCQEVKCRVTGDMDVTVTQLRHKQEQGSELKCSSRLQELLLTAFSHHSPKNNLNQGDTEALNLSTGRQPTIVG